MRRIQLNPVQYQPVKQPETKSAPIQTQPAQYQELSGVLPPIPIREFRGVNTFDPLSIADSFFMDASNLTSDDFPAVSVRPGYTVIGQSGSRVLGMGVWKDQELHVIFNDGTWQRWNGSSWATLKSGLDTSAEWTFTNFDGNLGGVNLIGTNGVNGLHRYDGSTVQTFSDAPAGLKYITTYQNRLWGALGNEIRASKLDDPASWNSFPGTDEDSYGKQIESTKGGEINALEGGLKKLTVGINGGIVELYGGLPSDFYTVTVTEDNGPISNKSAVTQEGVMYFVHPNGIFHYAGGVLPDRMSDIVKGYLSNVTDGIAGSDGDKLYFTVADKTLVYDQRTDTWHVWTGLNPAVFAKMGTDLFIGTKDGRVLKLGGQTDNGSGIAWHAITKPFTNASAAQRQRWLKMWVMAELGPGSTMNVAISTTVDGNDWTTVQSLTGSGTQIQRILIPVPGFALEHTVRVKFSGTGWARLHEFTRQVRQLPL